MSGHQRTRSMSIVMATPEHEQSRNRIEWLASLDTESRPGKNYRRTSIICTIGEPCRTKIADLILQELQLLTWLAARAEDEFRREDYNAPQRCVHVDIVKHIAAYLTTVGCNVVRMNFSHGTYDVRISSYRCHDMKS